MQKTTTIKQNNKKDKTIDFHEKHYGMRNKASFNDRCTTSNFIFLRITLYVKGTNLKENMWDGLLHLILYYQIII